MNHSVVPVNVTHADEIEKFTLQHLLHTSVLHLALGVGQAAYKPYIRSWLGPILDEELSCVVRDATSGDTVGCLVARDLDSTAGSGGSRPPVLDPMVALLAELSEGNEGTRSPAEPTILVDFALVAPAYTGHGLYTSMREWLHAHAAARGFRYVQGELSSAATQHICLKHFGHTTLNEIRYTDFRWNNTTPFAAIRTPPSIKLVKGNLPTKHI